MAAQWSSEKQVWLPLVVAAVHTLAAVVVLLFTHVLGVPLLQYWVVGHSLSEAQLVPPLASLSTHLLLLQYYVSAQLRSESQVWPWFAFTGLHVLSPRSQ